MQSGRSTTGQTLDVDDEIKQVTNLSYIPQHQNLTDLLYYLLQSIFVPPFGKQMLHNAQSRAIVILNRWIVFLEYEPLLEIYAGFNIQQYLLTI